MKKLLCICLFVLPSCFAMEQPAHNNSSDEQEEAWDIGITKPLVNPDNNKREIQLLKKEDTLTPIGYIIYFKKNENPHSWCIDKFYVNRGYRDLGYGRDLFKECITDIKAQGGTKVTWTACPTDALAINWETLVSIYQQIIEKLGYTPEAFTKSAPQGLGIIKQVVMSLQL